MNVNSIIERIWLGLVAVVYAIAIIGGLVGLFQYFWLVVSGLAILTGLWALGAIWEKISGR